MPQRVSQQNGMHASGVLDQDLSDVATGTPEACVPSAKRDLLAKLLRGDVDQELNAPRAIMPRGAGTAPQLSFSQQRLWFLDQLMPGSPVFNVPIAVPMPGDLDVPALQRCVDEIVRRHEVFRTRFVTVDGQPAPFISSSVETSIQIIDLTGWAESARRQEYDRLARSEALCPFDLTQAPLLRTTLIRLSDRQSVFLLTMHHIVSDGTSILIFFRELAALYQAFQNGKVSPLDELAVQYSDYACWQKTRLQGDLLAQQLSYWKQQLAGKLPVLDLPADRSRPPVQTFPGDRVTVTLPAELTDELKALGQREGTTLFMTLLAAFKVLLQRYTGQEDIIVGTPIANRPHTETEGLIGLFLNNLALRSDVSGNPQFCELLARVRRTALDAYANQDVPFERLIEELKPERDLSRTSIFQVYFNLFSFSDRIDLPNGETINFVDAWLNSAEDRAKFDLTLYAGAGEKEIKLAFLYNTDLFSRPRIEQMAGQFKYLLQQLAAGPEQQIGNFSLVTPDSGRLLPDPAQPLEAHRGEAITVLFSRQAQRSSDHLAVIDPTQSWTYQQLEARTNQLAADLRRNGIESGDVVAVWGARSAALVSAIIGILKAGAAFTILDPAYPPPRLIECLKISAPRGFIEIETAGPLPEELSDFVGQNVGCHFKHGKREMSLVSRAQDAPPQRQTDTVNQAQPSSPDDLAYIAFTSGSTGRPKGVMGRQGPLTLFTSWAIDKFGLNERDRFCMLSGLAHDPLHRDIFTPLQLGGTICIPDPADLEAPVRLRAWMKTQKITVANLTPAMSQLLSEGAETAEEIDSLRYSFLVGDALTKRDVVRLKRLAPSITCVNLYGSTETQRAVGHYVVPDNLDDSSEKKVWPLGKGIRDVQLLVLNEQQRLCGVSETGEIYFRSPHLARGYLGDEQLTRERFIRNPFTNQPGDRLYRTGDLGRYLPDGNVEHLGRADRQIKIRGFRIEPAETESALTSHPQVREAAVIAQPDESGELRLVAYVVKDQPKDFSKKELSSSPELRDFLSARLPAYMVPAAFVQLEALPLTPNGKLDRAALPAPDKVDREPIDGGPQSAIEQALLEVWQETLTLKQIGIHDNFFDLGGHSLMAVRLFAAIEQRFGRRLPLTTLFQAPTVARLAAVLEQNSSSAWSSLVPIQTGGTRPPFFCVHAVGGNVLEYYDLARHLGTNQPFYAFQSRGLDGTQPPHTRIEDMAAHYVKELRELQPEGPYFIGGRSLGGTIAFEMARQLNAQGQQIGLLALLDSYPVGHARLLHDDSVTTKAGQLLRRVRAHVANICSLRWRDRLGYVIDKAQYAPLRIKSTIWRQIYRSYQSLGQEVPAALRDVEEFNWLAAHQYVPHFYDGALTLFWAHTDLRAKFDLLEGWQALARGGMEVHEIPGTHLDMIKEPHVAELAKKLDACLERAQRRVPQRTQPIEPSRVRENRAA